jgi:hypothetical protein
MRKCSCAQADQSVSTLIQAAGHAVRNADWPIGGRHRALFRPGALRWRLGEGICRRPGSGRLLLCDCSAAGGGGRRCTAGQRIRALARLLSMRDELCIAGIARPRRQTVWLAAGKVRPVVGNYIGKPAARYEHDAETDSSSRCKQPPDDHVCRRVSG